MAAEKVTPMVLKVDLQCPCCYKKIKKTLCKFPQIRDQVYDEKKNTVTITVVCCSPEKIRDKLCSKGRKVIKSIDIIEVGKPKQPEKPKEAEKPKQPEKPMDADKPKEKPKEAEKPKDKPKEAEKVDKPKPDGAGKPKEAPKAEPPKIVEPAAKPAQVKGPEPAPANGVPSIFPYCGPSYDPYAAGPYYHGYGFPPPPPQQLPCYEGYYGHPHGHGYPYGYGGVVQANKYDNYSNEENHQCTIM